MLDDADPKQGVTRAGLQALCDKYAEIERLRRAQDAGETPTAPRDAMAALAQRFPGALRELDELPAAELQARIAALRDALRDPGAVPAWAALQLAYHGLMRCALRAKRWGAAGDDVEAIVVRLRARAREPGDPAPELLTAELVSQALRPPQGRLNPWAFAWVGARLGVPGDAVRSALFKR